MKDSLGRLISLPEAVPFFRFFEDIRDGR